MAATRAVIGCVLLLVITPLTVAEEDDQIEALRAQIAKGAAEEDDQIEDLRAQVAEEVGEYIGDAARLFDTLVSKEEKIKIRERQLRDSNALLEIVKNTFEVSTKYLEDKNSEVEALKDQIDRTEKKLKEEKNAHEKLKEELEEHTALHESLEKLSSRVKELEASVFPVWLQDLAKKVDKFMSGQFYPKVWSAYERVSIYLLPFTKVLKARCLKLWKLASPTLKTGWDKTSGLRSVIAVNLIAFQKKFISYLESTKFFESDFAKSLLVFVDNSETYVLKALVEIEWAKESFGNKETASFVVFAAISIAAMAMLYMLFSIISWGLRGTRQNANSG